LNWLRASLRLRIVAATAVVMVAMLALLVANSILTDRAALLEQAERWSGDITPLLNAALAAPLAQRDYATVQQVLEEIRSDRSLRYLVLQNHTGDVVAAAGWPADQPLPPVDVRVSEGDPDGRFDRRVEITLAGQRYGSLQVGLDTGFLRESQSKLLAESLAIGLAALAASLALLWIVGWLLTRHLQRLTAASQSLAQGDYSVRVDVAGEDEVGQLGAVFNTMARAVEDRLAQMRASEARFHAIADYSYDCELWLSPVGKPLWINSRATLLTGYEPDECMAMPNFPVPLAAPQDRDRLAEQVSRALGGTQGADVEFRLRRKDGSEIWVSADWRPIYDVDGSYGGIRISIHDVTQRHEAEEKLSATLQELEKAYAIQREYLALASEERARLNALLAAMHIGILFVDRNNKVIYSNPAFEQIWLLAESRARFVGMDARALLSQASHLLTDSPLAGDQPPGELLGDDPGAGREIEMADGRLVTQVCYPVRDGQQQLVGHLWLYEDVTRERQTAEQLLYLAERDALTGLYNRHRFQDELNRMVSECDRQGTRVALLFFDVDEFKHINDTFGHRAGDAMLIRVAGEVSAQVRRNEIFARLGGDEFAILAPELQDSEANGFAERIVRAAARIPFSFEGHNLRLTCSLGVAIYPDHAANAEDLVAHADLAMYRAKEAGKNTWRMYLEDLGASQAAITRLNWNDRIARALETNMLVLHFQGIFECGSGALTHLEALVRMVDPVDPSRLVMPNSFIPVAEKTGRILDIDRWVIAEAIRLLARSPSTPPIAVNISGRSFNEPNLPRYIADELRRAGVAPARLIVELTETSAVSDLHDAQRFIEALRVTGCKVCLDDFGAGFSSFAYLKHIEADILKIDGQFIRNLPGDRVNQVFLKAMVDVASGLRKVSVAECVEDEATLTMLRSLGVDRCQGYHLERPRADHPALAVETAERLQG
jgi:diguanylate cyclase (GGDEF)-like protein/PAS domain S-box-containing protein